MLELLVGAAIAAVFSFLGGWILVKVQHRHAEDLALRLRALERQEGALRELSIELGSILDSFRHVPESEPPTGSPSEYGPSQYVGVWHELRGRLDKLDRRWRSELGADVIDTHVPRRYSLLRQRLGIFSEEIGRYANSEATLEDVRSEGRQLLEEIENLRGSVDRARRGR